MDIRDRASLRQAAAQRLSQAAYSPRKLVLLHTGVSLGVSFLLSLLSFLLSRQMEGVHGLAGMESQAMLETAQTVLQLISTVALPFWQMGILCAAIRLARGEEAVPATLLGGFYRIGPVLRLQLLRTLFIAGLSVASVYTCVFTYMMTPLADPLMEAMLPMMEQSSPLDMQLMPDEATMELIMSYMEPLTVVATVLALIASIPLLLCMRYSDYLVMDGEDRAMAAIKRSWKMTRGNLWPILKIDLSFWPFYSLMGLSLVLGYADLLLPLVGVELPLQAEVASFLFYLLYIVVQLALYWWMGARVQTTYALCYDALYRQTQPAPVPAAPDNRSWDH